MDKSEVHVLKGGLLLEVEAVTRYLPQLGEGG